MKTLLIKSLLLAFTLAFFGCSSDDDKDDITPTPENAKFVVMTSSDRSFGGGYFSTIDGMPGGTLPTTNAKSLQISDAFGFRTFGKWIFNRSNAAGDEGLQKFTVNADGSLKDEGFIAGSTQFLVVSATSGYYLDETRGTLKIQKFNPTTMLRTGEIDLSVVKKDGVEYQAVGKHTIAAKEGKLYLSITYGTNVAKGYGDDVFNSIFIAVVDIATEKYEKTITYDGLKGIGWGSSGNKMWSIGDDGALYLYNTGLNVAFTTTNIIRIKKGETDFDKTWKFSTDQLQAGNSLAIALVKGGKLYFEMVSTPLKPDFSNLPANPIFDFYTYDMTTKQVTKLGGMPQHEYVYANEQSITEIDGKVYLWVKNQSQNIDGYYVVDGDKATQVFNIQHQGAIQGFAKLSE
ncbi:hypothetical protein SAMN05216327_10182 [Dyadobacter sp. SG02]|uniref:hypothetical protein n=1 Tax=Dyadobacter sp. SG02 TaxID=1855291 RepID=UPI0008D4E0BF|nr:hypothetical protein [Dyadobacter sp. SG02]SEI38255.1 hypothetical protein SAMN05216327_10182 [Dyadobacter sp. SG02]